MYIQLEKYYFAIKNFFLKTFQWHITYSYVIMIQMARMNVNVFVQKYFKKTYQSMNNACLCGNITVYLYFLFDNFFLYFICLLQYITFIIRKHNKSY